MRIRWPSWIPAGISTSSSFASIVRPFPLHALQGVSTTVPAPRQVGQAWVRTNSPKTLRETCCTWPRPAQVWQVTRSVPGSAPFPSQTSHVAATSTSTVRSTPVNASASSIATATPTSPPRARPPRFRAKRSSPKKAEKMSLRFEKAKSLGA